MAEGNEPQPVNAQDVTTVINKVGSFYFRRFSSASTGTFRINFTDNGQVFLIWGRSNNGTDKQTFCLVTLNNGNSAYVKDLINNFTPTVTFGNSYFNITFGNSWTFLDIMSSLAFSVV